MAEMTFRERWVGTFHYEPVDRVPDVEFGYWTETLPTWHQQGLPRNVTTEAEAYRHFGIDMARNWGLPGSIGMIPGFETKVLSETASHRVVRNADGTVTEVPKDGHSTIPKYLEFPVKDRQDFENIKERYDPDDPRRYPKPEDLPRLREAYKHADGLRICGCGGFYGWARKWIGMENLSLLFHDDPDLIAEMFAWMADFVIKVKTRAAEMLDIPNLRIDVGTWWEDMCYRSGPLISPAMFDKFEVPNYIKVTSWLRENFGTDLNYVDCDGNINSLAPLWLKAGVNIMFPVEIAAGTDPYLLREQLGKEVRFLGGVNKRELAKDKAAIDAEIERLRPLFEDGGFIPHVDHRCPPDVPLENYYYYLEQKRKLIGKA